MATTQRSERTRVHVSLTPEMLRQVQTDAERLGIPVATLLRMIVVEHYSEGRAA